MATRVAACMWQLNGFRYLKAKASKTADVKLSIRINSSVCVHFILAAAHLIWPAIPIPFHRIEMFILDLEITTCVCSVYWANTLATVCPKCPMSITRRRRSNQSKYLPTLSLMTHFEVVNALRAPFAFIDSKCASKSSAQCPLNAINGLLSAGQQCSLTCCWNVPLILPCIWPGPPATPPHLHPSGRVSCGSRCWSRWCRCFCDI